MKTISLLLPALMVSTAAFAQAKMTPSDVKVLTPAECATITKRSADEFFIAGPVRIGGLTISNSAVGRRGVIVNGVDNFDVINRSCFNGKPS